MSDQSHAPLSSWMREKLRSSDSPEQSPSVWSQVVWWLRDTGGDSRDS